MSLIERCRYFADWFCKDRDAEASATFTEAATQLEAMQAEIERLREAPIKEIDRRICDLKGELAERRKDRHGGAITFLTAAIGELESLRTSLHGQEQ